MKTAIQFLGFFFICFAAQTQTIPGGYQSLFSGKNAAEQVRLADSLSTGLRNTEPGQAIALSRYALQVARDNQLHEPAVKACLSISRTYRSKGAHDTSLAWTDSAHAYAAAHDLRAQYGHIFDYRGLVYMRMGNYTKATESFYLSILSSEKINDSLRLHDAFDHLGTVSFYRSEFRMAIYYYQRSLRYIPANAPPRPYAVTADNIGTAYTNLDNPDSALYYQQQVVNMVGALYDSTFEAEVFINISATLLALERFEEAASYLDRAYAISTATHNKYALINANLYKGRLLYKTGKAREAIPYLETAYELAAQLKIPVMIKQTASSLSEVYKLTGDYRKASAYYEILTEAMLAVAKEENQKAINELSARYDNEKQQQQIKLLTLDAEVKEQVIRNDRNLKFIYGAVALMFLVVSGIFIYRFLEKRKANRLLQEKTEAIARQKTQIEMQKEELQVKNKETTDSIHYAKRIQRAVIPSDKLVRSLLPESFIYFRPKDIVSGDFYWAAEKVLAVAGQEERKFIYFAVADCTGHGVPGAMMSMLATSLLNRLVADGAVKMPAGILGELHEAVVKSLNEDIDRRALHDGMDIALLLIDPAEKKLHFAGAARSLYYAPGGQTLHCIRGDKFSIGDSSGMSDLRFTSHTIDFSTPVMLYLFSDGVPDQFGGPKGKKFMLKQLLEVLEAGLHLPPAEQESRFAAALEAWMQGNEQTDDITLAGIRLA